MKKAVLFKVGLLGGLATLSIAFASVPKADRVTNDTALYEKLSEIRVARQGELNFDGDLQRLTQIEARYREGLPDRVSGPSKRISNQKYQAGKPQAKLRR